MMKSTVEEYLADERMRSAVEELKAVISARYPEVKYQPYVWEDPAGLYLEAMVDIDDTEEVTDLVIDRLVRMYFDEEIPIHLIPVRTPERQAAMREQERIARERLKVTS
jgi:hypothetical protein